MLLRGPPSTTALTYLSKYVNAGKIRSTDAGFRAREPEIAGLCLKGENSRVAAIIGSYPAIFPLYSPHTLDSVTRDPRKTRLKPPKPGNKQPRNSSKTENKTFLNASVCHIWHTEPN